MSAEAVMLSALAEAVRFASVGLDRLPVGCELAGGRVTNTGDWVFAVPTGYEVSAVNLYDANGQLVRSCLVEPERFRRAGNYVVPRGLLNIRVEAA